MLASFTSSVSVVVRFLSCTYDHVLAHSHAHTCLQSHSHNTISLWLQESSEADVDVEVGADLQEG